MTSVNKKLTNCKVVGFYTVILYVILQLFHTNGFEIMSPKYVNTVFLALGWIC